MDRIVVRFKAQAVNRGRTNVRLNQLLSHSVYKENSERVDSLSAGEVQTGCLYELVYIHDIAGQNVYGRFLTNPIIKLPEIPPPPQTFLAGFIGNFAWKKYR